MYVHPWNYTLRNETLLEVPGEKALQQGKGRKTLPWRRTSWKEWRIWKDKMCIYFLLSWALVRLFEVGYLNFPPVSNVPGKENWSFCVLKQPQQEPTGQGKPRAGGRPASKNATAPFPKNLCRTHLRGWGWGGTASLLPVQIKGTSETIQGGFLIRTIPTLTVGVLLDMEE